MTGRSAKIAISAATLAALAGGFWWALSERPQAVETVSVVSAPMAVTIEEDGQTRVREIYRISAPITGNTGRSLLEVGDQVKADETVVATMTPLQPAFMDERARAEARAQANAARAAVGVAEAELAQARSAFELARADFERANRLARSNTISDASLDKARADADLKQALVTSAEAAVNLRRSELASAIARLIQPGDQALREPDDRCCVEVKAPIDGVVLSLAVKSEQVIQAGAPLAEIGDPSEIEIVVDLLSADAVRVAPGAPVLVRGWGGAALAGTLRRIDPAGFTKVSALGIEEQRVNAVIDLEEKNPALGHGFHVRVALEVWRSPSALQVPVAALFRQGNQWAVFAVEDGLARLRTVEVGQMNNRSGEVIDGLAEGETVIVFPGDTLSDGVPVEPLSDAPDAAS